jgi:NADH-quinone oxidoreductase subunit H
LKGLAGIFFYKRGVQQKHLYTGVKRAEPFLFAWLCFAVTAAMLLILAADFATEIPAWVYAVAPTILQLLCLILKVLFFCWFFVWVRWTLPRFRYDQLMKMGWKIMLPLALLNLLVTGVIILSQK